MWWRVAVGGAVALALLAPSAPASAVAQAPFVVEAHRGGDLGAAENSTRAFQLAGENPIADRVELDVLLSSDGVPVIRHDSQLDARCDRYHGSHVRSLTAAQLQSVRCQGEPIPTLVEAVAVIKAAGMTMNLEIKSWALDTESAASIQRTATVAIRTALAAGMGRRMILSSFRWKDISPVVQRLAPAVPFQALSRRAPVKLNATPMAYIRSAAKAGVDIYMVPVEYATEPMIRLVRELGMKIAIYDPRSVADVRFAAAHRTTALNFDDLSLAERGIADLARRPLTTRFTVTTQRSRTVLAATLKAGRKRYAKVTGAGRIPAASQQYLHSSVVSVKVTGRGKAGTLTLAPRNGARSSAVKLAIPAKGTKTYRVRVGPGDHGQLRVSATRAASVKVRTSGYRRTVH